MKKFLVTALLLCIAWGAFAQAIDVSKLDLSGAQFSIAGPDSVYVRSIVYDGTQMSVLLRYNEQHGAIVYGPYFDEDKWLLDSYMVEKATARLETPDKIIISNLDMGGQGLGARLQYDGEYTLVLTSYWNMPAPKDDATIIAELRSEMQSQQARYSEQIAATETRYEADIQSLEAELDSARAQIDSLTAQVARERQRAAAQQPIASAAALPSPAPGAALAGPMDVERLDVSEAVVSTAGPESVYVRNLYYEGTRLSVILKFDGIGGALIYGPYFDGDKLLLDSDQLGKARLRVQGDDTLIVSDLILAGTGYAGRFEYDGVYTLNLASFWETMAPKTDEMVIAELQDQLRSSVETIASLRQDLAQARVAAAPAVTAVPAVMPARVIRTGFSGGRSLFGTWSASATRAAQSDSNLFFTKYSIPVAQSANRTLYSITGSATGSGHIGYGLHFFASGERTGNGYGFGSSYLVWLTRDRGYYGTDSMYVQLYQSFDDVNMIQLASTAVSGSIGQSNKTEVLYDRNTRTITIMVNGDVAFSYGVPSPIQRGDKVALRTLGAPVTFTELSIKTE